VTDIDPSSIFEGKQGEVVGVQFRFWQPAEIRVKFDRNLDPYQVGYGMVEKDPVFLYSRKELRKDSDWTPETYARRKFGKYWHSISVRKSPLDPTQLCCVEDCPHTQKHVVWVNIWGTVINVYLCDEHAKYYRYWSCMDSFPHRTVVCQRSA
jgi:hypothetical protein